MTSSYLLLNDLRVHYLHWNLADGGQPVVLLHGLAANARIWELVAPLLAGRGLATFAPDLRGHGLTDQPEGEYGFETYQRDLAAFVTANDLQKPVLVGHSWGAMLALDYAARFPFGPLAPGGIVLVDGGLDPPSSAGPDGLDELAAADREARRERLSPPRWEGASLDAFLDHLNRPGEPWRPDDRALQILLASFEVSEEETLSPRLKRDNHLQILRAIQTFKASERYNRLNCPVLMVPARPPEPHTSEDIEDIQFKENGIAQARQKIAVLRVHWVPDTIHDVPLQRPAELAELIASFAQSVKEGMGHG